ncbi:MAG: MATE family efflux transporter, partial [Sphingobacteriia bacterium]|nr:MATE family efflux transporter [Sphingobacteriia bacterium]
MLFFAIPMLIGNFFHIFNTLIDSIIVGNYIGKGALAAIGTSFPVIFALISLIIGVSGGISIVISQYFGAKDIKNVRKAIDTAFVFLFVSSFFISILGIIFAPAIFKMLQLAPDVLPEAVTYMRIYLAGIVFMAGFNGSMAILRGLGDSKTPLYFIIITSILNILLELLFIVVLKMGIEGAAYATIGAQVVGFFISLIYLNRTHDILKISLIPTKFDRKIFQQSLRIGLPSGAQQVFVALGMVALLRIVNEFGTDAMAGYTVAGRIDSFASLPAMNFAIALSAFVGQNIGAGKFGRVINGLKATIVLTSIISITVSLLVGFFAHELMEIFTNDLNVVEIGARYLVIISPFYILFSLMFSFAGVLRGAGDTLIPMFIT